MNPQDYTFWILPAALIRDFRTRKLNATETLVMAYLINLAPPYYKTKEAIMVVGLSLRQWFLILRRLKALGMVSTHPVRPPGWMHVRVFPPYRLPQPVRDTWHPISDTPPDFHPSHLGKTERALRMFRLKKMIQRELQEAYSEPEDETPGELL
jgi:hypothetical protein